MPPPVPAAMAQAAAVEAAPSTQRFVVTPHEEFEKPAKNELKTFKVPQVILLILGGTVGMILAGMILPISVTVTTPMMAILGAWALLGAVKINAALPPITSRSGAQGNRTILFLVLAKPSEMGRLARLVGLIGLAPIWFLLFGVFLGLAAGYAPEIGILVRILLVFYLIAAAPFLWLALQRIGKITQG